ncbi:ATP-binding protein [Arthrobacter alpinus]|nr:ATP-binding protein [Arthrobacter alpinus]
MTLNAQGYRIIGASFLGPKPIGCSHIDISSGSTMFYGKNGVGKTRLLDQVTKAFQGIGKRPGMNKPQSLIHIDVDVRSKEGDNAFMLELYEMLDIDREIFLQDEDRSEFQTAVLERVNEWTELDLDDPLDLLEYPELRKSLGFNFSLAPSGTPESRSWTVYLSAILDDKERHNLALYGTELSRITRSMFMASTFDDSPMTADAPYQPAQAPEWYKEPFEIVKGSSSVEQKYLQLGASPLDSWPAHLPVPLVRIGSITRGPAQAFINSMPLKDIQQSTLSLVASSTKGKGHLVEGTDGADVVLSSAAEESVLKAETETNRILKILADFPFKVRFDTGTPSDWFAGNTPQWTAVPVFDDQSKITLADLSFSQQKWVRFALSLYLTKLDKGMPRVIIVDEPEQGFANWNRVFLRDSTS